MLGFNKTNGTNCPKIASQCNGTNCPKIASQCNGTTKLEGSKVQNGPKRSLQLAYGLSKTPSYPAIKMARITITKDGYRDNVIHALSL